VKGGKACSSNLKRVLYRPSILNSLSRVLSIGQARCHTAECLSSIISSYTEGRSLSALRDTTSTQRSGAALVRERPLLSLVQW